MRPFRADDEAHGRILEPSDEQDDGGADALRSIYAARIAAARLTAPKGMRRAAVRALRDEQKAAMRELTQRRQEKRKARREAVRIRVPGSPTPKPRK